MKFILLILIVQLAVSTTLLAQPEVDPAVKTRIATYLGSLDANRFEDRELGLQGLASMGDAAIRPLAVQIITGTPESAWRSKQALEAIGIRGNEESFLKTACVLKLLFIGANETLTQRIADLEIQWTLEQKRNILIHLKSKGARVIESPQQLGGFDELIFWDGLPAAPMPDLEEPTNRNRLAAARVSAKRPTIESIQEVDEILDASLEENRSRLFGDPLPERKLSAEETLIDPEVLMELRLQRRFGVPLRGQIVGRNQGFPLDGITVVLDQQWKGGAADLARAVGLRDFKRVEIEHIDLSEEEYEALADVPSILSVKLVGEQVPTERFKAIAKFKKVFELEIADRNVQPDEITELGPLAELAGLTFKNCQISSDVIKELKVLNQLRSLALMDMKIAPEVLVSLAEVENLKLLNLDLCKFQIDSYRALKAARPELEIGFTPQALLGVRGPMDLSDAGCEISQVVPNSGAALGGLKPGDVVLKIDGQTVEIFEDLRLHVAQHQAGDVLSLVVRRDDKEVELKIQLTPFQEID
jgi:hypothetical protein